MNTTVITVTEHDFGAGSDRRIEFRGCKWKVDGNGCLHVYQESQQGGVSVAAFSPGAWLAATNGSIHGAGVSVASVAGERV